MNLPEVLLDRRRGGLNGWLEAGMFVFAIAALTVVYAIAQQAGAHLVVFILYAMFFSAAFMLLLTGLGDNPLVIALAPASLVFGSATVLLEAFYFQLLGALTPAETSLALRLAVPVSLIVGWLFASRWMSTRLWIGSLIIVAAVVPVILHAPPERHLEASLLALACSLIVSVKTFASEFHRANRAARSALDKLRVTGLVVITTALLATALLVPLVILRAAGLAFVESAFIPPPAAFLQPATLILGILIGAPVFVAMTYLTFASVVKIGTESFLATSAFTPFAVLLLERVAVTFGLLATGTFEVSLLPYIAIGIVGVLIVVHERHRGGP